MAGLIVRKYRVRFANEAVLRLTGRVWFKFIGKLKPREQLQVEPLRLGSRSVPLMFVRHPRARRYRLRLRSDGNARVTIPRGGSVAEARRFVEHSRDWLEQQLQKLDAQPRQPSGWHLGSEFFFRGELVQIFADANGTIRFGSEVLPMVDNISNFRSAIEKHLRRLATQELPLRVGELARQHGLTVKRVTVRNQRTRWGSCSRHGTISLNWRLIQTPGFVRDYIILHELAHTRQMNHSERFWREVEALCPDYLTAENWLKQHKELLR